MNRLVADANLSHHFIKACQRLQRGFPMVHIAGWLNGEHRTSKDHVLLPALHQQSLIVVSFDRSTMAMHAGRLTRDGAGHSGVILFRRSVSLMDFGKQSRLLVDFWHDAASWDWADRIEYLPRA